MGVGGIHLGEFANELVTYTGATWLYINWLGVHTHCISPPLEKPNRSDWSLCAFALPRFYELSWFYLPPQHSQSISFGFYDSLKPAVWARAFHGSIVYIKPHLDLSLCTA